MAEEPGEIRRDIEETRAEMSETVDALQERLSPAHIKSEVKDAVRESAVEAKDRVQGAVMQTTEQAGRGFIQIIRENPLPSALAGIGLGWLAMSARRSSSGSSPNQSMSPNAHSAATTQDYMPSAETTQGFTQAGEQAAGQVRQAGSQVQSQATELGHEAQQQARRARSGFQRVLEENPLAVAAVAVAAGAAVGMAIPETKREQEVLGGARAAVTEQLEERALEMTDKAERVVEAVQETATDEAKRQDLVS